MKEKMKKRKRIFLDYASITPVDGKVRREMEQAQKFFWANPSSLHAEGESAKNILEEARMKIARLLHCRKNEVFFTSGGTESLNLAIFGAVKSAKDKGIFPHVITPLVEHSAVLEPIKFLIKEKQIEASFIQPDQNGRINPESVKKEIKENTVLIAIQHSNNEIGVIQPIRAIKNATGNPGKPFLLVDASQSVLYENISVERLGADLVVLDGIKMYGPRGAGILVVKHRVDISPVIFGGGQEGGLRSGTENTANAVGLARALEIAFEKMKKESLRLTQLRDYAINKILKEVPGSSLNGSLENRLPNNINICFAPPRLDSRELSLKSFASSGDSQNSALDSEFLVIKLDTLGFAVSAASACHALSLENSSYVINALGNNCGSSSLRFTLGRETKKSDLDRLISALKKIII